MGPCESLFCLSLQQHPIRNANRSLFTYAHICILHENTCGLSGSMEISEGCATVRTVDQAISQERTRQLEREQSISVDRGPSIRFASESSPSWSQEGRTDQSRTPECSRAGQT